MKSREICPAGERRGRRVEVVKGGALLIGTGLELLLCEWRGGGEGRAGEETTKANRRRSKRSLARIGGRACKDKGKREGRETTTTTGSWWSAPAMLRPMRRRKRTRASKPPHRVLPASRFPLAPPPLGQGKRTKTDLCLRSNALYKSYRSLPTRSSVIDSTHPEPDTAQALQKFLTSLTPPTASGSRFDLVESSVLAPKPL